MLKKALNCALLPGATMTAELAGAGELTLYSRDDCHGRSRTVRDAVADLEDVRFNDTTQSRARALRRLGSVRGRGFPWPLPHAGSRRVREPGTPEQPHFVGARSALTRGRQE